MSRGAPAPATPTQAPRLAMLQCLSGYWFSQTLYVVAELGIADLLQRGPRRAVDLARHLRVDEESLYRLLRAVAAMGLFRRIGHRSFGLTSLSATLIADAPDSLRPLALLGGHPAHWRAWGELLHSVRTGKPAFRRANGVGFFEAFRRHRGLAVAFQGAMLASSQADGAVLAAYDFASIRTVVDVGGGSGDLLGKILDQCPQTTGILVDRPEVLRTVTARPRLRLAAGNFFEAVPRGGDVYLLKFVLHDWDDRRAATLLRRCRSAMGRTGRLLVVEVLLPDDNRPSVSETHDLNMLVLTGGRERTRPEYASLFRRAGFRLTRVISTTGDVSLLEAAPLPNGPIKRTRHISR